MFGRNDAKAETPVLWPPHVRADSLEKTLMLGGNGGKRRRGRQRMRWLDCIRDSMDVSLSELWEMVIDREAWHAAIHRVTKSRTRLSTCTELDCSPPGSSVHGIFQARVLGWGAIAFSRKFSSVQFSRSVVSDSLRPHELQHARPPCPSPTPRVHSDSHPSSQ